MKSNADYIRDLSSEDLATRQEVFSELRDDEVYKAAIYTIEDTDTKVISALFVALPTHLIGEALDWFLQPQNLVTYSVFRLLASRKISDSDFDRLLSALTLKSLKIFLTTHRMPIVAMNNIEKFSDRLLKIKFKDVSAIRDEDTELRFVLGISDEDFLKNNNRIVRLFNSIDGLSQSGFFYWYCEYIYILALAARLKIPNRDFSSRDFFIK